MQPPHRLAYLGLTLALAAGVYAHVRLIYSANGETLYWSDPQAIRVVINSDGSDNIDGAGHLTAIRNGIAAWNAVPSTTAYLKEDKSPSEQKSRNWASSSRHLILFDEDNSSGYFPGSSGIVAITPLTFYTNGEIIDADILFNGKSYAFTTSGEFGSFDVQDVVTHELGHVLGLDHTGCAGASMYPYVDPTITLHRSLALDDAHGLQDVYPPGAPTKVKGTIRRASDGTKVRGAWVGARDEQGRLVGAALTNENGRFALGALPAGSYTVYASPLEEPVSSGNLAQGHTVEVDFQSTVLTSAVATPGKTTELGDLLVNGDCALSLGRVADDYPIRLVAGEATAVIVRGAGLVDGSTLEASDPDVTLSAQQWSGSGSYVTFDASAPASAEPGHFDLTVTDPAGNKSILCGGLEVTPSDPVVLTVDPPSAAAEGGAVLTVTGWGFRAGLRVVIGDRIYAAGEAGGATLVDSATLALTLGATLPGTHDVVVIDETGVEGRLDAGFEATAVPAIESVFPNAGASSGGTELLIQGENFVAGTTVTIAGVEQTNTTVEGLELLRVVTEPGAPGGPYALTISSPAGDTAQDSFTYAAKPDPVLSAIQPASGSAAGGETVTLSGANFTAASQVWFAVGELAGKGGVKAHKVTLVDSSTLLVVTPESSSTKGTVMVKEGDSGQASLLSGAFVFVGGDDDSSGAGGACAAVSCDASDGWREWLSGAGWMLVLLALSALRPRAAAAAR